MRVRWPAQAAPAGSWRRPHWRLRGDLVVRPAQTPNGRRAGLPCRRRPGVLAIYNPASVTRNRQVGDARAAAGPSHPGHTGGDWPATRPRPVSGPNEDVRGEAGRPNPAEIDMRCLLIVGSLQTRWCPVIRRPGTPALSRGGQSYRDKVEPPQRLKELAAEFKVGPGCSPEGRQSAPRNPAISRIVRRPSTCAERLPGGQPAPTRPKTSVPRHNACASAVRNRARQIVDNRS